MNNLSVLASQIKYRFSVTTEIDTGTVQFDEFRRQKMEMYNSLSGIAELKGNDHQRMVFWSTRRVHTIKTVDIDFYLPEENTAIQVSYSLIYPEERDVRSLILFAKTVIKYSLLPRLTVVVSLRSNVSPSSSAS